MTDLSFYRCKKVFITGHTGFKGTWLCKVLTMAGADVTGYALEPPTKQNLFDQSGIEQEMKSVIGDIRDLLHLMGVFSEEKPEIVFHLAAQPIVRESYNRPAYTYEVNVMGTVNILECIRQNSCTRSFLNVTTDKVYENRETERPYKEEDSLCGFDPYSNSKSCSELVTSSYKNSFFLDRGISISTSRSGNVIGGGDYSPDRIVPDCVRAAKKNKPIEVRNPFSIRPYQHVLEAVFAYLLIAQKQYEDFSFAGCYNVGPDECDCVKTEDLVSMFCEKWGHINWINKAVQDAPHEAHLLKLDNSKMKSVLKWNPRWNIEEAIEKTVEIYKAESLGEPVKQLMERQIADYLKR